MNQYLDDLALSNVKKDRPGMKKALQLLLRNTSAVEQKWLIRIILKVRCRIQLVVYIIYNLYLGLFSNGHSYDANVAACSSGAENWDE